MIGPKTRLKQYLSLVRGWAMGKNERGWFMNDFDNEQTMAERTSPTAVIFPIPPFPEFSWFELLFLTPYQYSCYLNFKQASSNFNASLAVVTASRRDLKDTYYGLIKLLHVFNIGGLGTGGLFDAYRALDKAIR